MTTQQTHTPGPWSRVQFDDEEFEVIVGPAGDERICEMRGTRAVQSIDTDLTLNRGLWQLAETYATA